MTLEMLWIFFNGKGKRTGKLKRITEYEEEEGAE